MTGRTDQQLFCEEEGGGGRGGKEGSEVRKENKQGSEEGIIGNLNRVDFRHGPHDSSKEHARCREHTAASCSAWHPVLPRLCQQNAC
jgi:hypothetical protein